MKIAALSFALWGLVCSAGSADEILLPKALERGQPTEIAYLFDTPATGRGLLDIEWRDTADRLVERRRIPLDLTDVSQVAFTLDMKRAVTIKNRLAAHLLFDEVDPRGNRVHREDRRTQSFIVTPPDAKWSDYQIIMWQRQSPAGYGVLKKLGVTAGMLETNHQDESTIYTPEYLARLADADLGCYLENIATDFYSSYHRWSHDLPENWRFLEAKRRYWANPLDHAAFIREPSLSDTVWLKRVQERLSRSVEALRSYRPLYYSLGDETGIGDLAAAWDFDFSAASLAAMRDWLKHRYESLTALNRQWGTAFKRWDEVMPMTTDEAIRRSDENFSAWADFKEWMDVAFAHAVKSGTDALHAADPNAISAIEGAQIPGWGGYDYSRLAGSVDAMELYDAGENVAIARSFNPKLIMLTNSSKGGPAEAHRVWRELLRGTRGLILWDDDHGFVAEDGGLGDRGREAAPYFGEIRAGFGALVINSPRHLDPIGILYSPASRRVQWLLDRRAARNEWSRRSASAEYQDDAIKTATRQFANALRHMGVQHRFVSSEEVQQGALRNENYRVLILPHTIALARREVEEIGEFIEQGGVLISDGEPGLFDDHGRRMATPLLSEVFHGPPTRSASRFAFGKGKAIYLASSGDRQNQSGRRLSRILDTGGVKPLLSLLYSDGRPADDVETHILTNGGLTIVALQRDYVRLATRSSREILSVQLPHAFNVYDIRSQREFVNTDRMDVELGPVEPVFLTLSERLLASPFVSGPASAHPGDIVEFRIASGSPAAQAVIHLEVVDPEGDLVGHYSGNVLIGGDGTTKLLPLAFDDKIGVWKLHARDLLSGKTAISELRVEP